MATNEKMSKALKSAKTHLENSMLAVDKKDEKSLSDSLWHVAAELEYILFLFSMSFQDESDTSMWKPSRELKKVETGPMLIEVEKLLNETKRFIVNERLRDAYKSVYIARHYIFKVQEDLTKKRRETTKKK